MHTQRAGGGFTGYVLCALMSCTHSYVLGKVNRVKYGLLRERDMGNMPSNMCAARQVRPSC